MEVPMKYSPELNGYYSAVCFMFSTPKLPNATYSEILQFAIDSIRESLMENFIVFLNGHGWYTESIYNSYCSLLEEMYLSRMMETLFFPVYTVFPTRADYQ